MKKPRELLFACGIALWSAAPAHSTEFVKVTPIESSVSSCDAALVEDTYNRTQQTDIDWRLAQTIDKNTYNKVKTDLGVTAVIYGVPIGANYQDFKENISNFETTQQQSYTEEDFINVAWTALDPQSSKNYSNCLKALAVDSRKTLVLLPVGATPSDITFDLIYTPSGTTAPNPLPVKWTLGGVPVPTLPLTMPAGQKPITVKRPTKEVTLVVSATAVGDGDSMVLEPLPPPLPPAQKYAQACQILSTPDPLPSIAPYGTYSWPCSPMAAGTYRATASITPGSGFPARVGWEIVLISTSGGLPKEIPLPLTSGSPIDINVEAGLPHQFQSLGGIVVLAQGPIAFELKIGGVFDHCCFGSGNDKAGDVTIPKDVVLNLENISDTKK